MQVQRNTTGDDGLELWPDSASAANIGIMLFRKRAGKLAKVSSPEDWRELSHIMCAVLQVDSAEKGFCRDWRE